MQTGLSEERVEDILRSLIDKRLVSEIVFPQRDNNADESNQ
jgi:hypothetical protein